MEWKTPKRYDKRVVTRFLYFPVNIDGITRWLTKVTMEQEYVFGFWMNRKFID